MKALRYEAFGEPRSVVVPTEVPLPQPGRGEVRLRLVRSPIHNHDLATVRGTYGYKPRLPATGGTEMLGVVDAIGDGVEGVTPGARVAAMLAEGAWAEYALAPVPALVPMPEVLSDEVACQLLAMPLSAMVLLDDLRVKPGDWIVQNAANGTVGRIVMRLGQKAGVNVINVVRREDAAEELRSFGAEHVVVTADAGWPQRVRETAGEAPIARVVDSVCDAGSTALNALLGKHGEHVVFGALAGGALKLNPGALIFSESIVRGFWMSAWMRDATPEQRAGAFKRLFAHALANELPLPAGGTFELGKASQALEAAETPGRSGKMLFGP